MLDTILLALLAALLGAAFCFAGYRLFLALLPVWGFFGGLVAGGEAVASLLGTGFLATTTGLIVAVVTGLVAALLSYMFYTAGVAIVAAGFGGALAWGILEGLGIAPGLIAVVVTAAAALASMALALITNVQKYVIVTLSATAGASWIALGGMLVTGRVTLADLQGYTSFAGPILQGAWFWGIVWLVLVGIGLMIQLYGARPAAGSQDMSIEGQG